MMDFIEKSRITTNQEFNLWKVKRIELARNIVPVLSKLNPKYKTTPYADILNTREIFDYYKAISTYAPLSKYMSPAAVRIYFLDTLAIEEVLNAIEKDPRVLFIDKHKMMLLIDMYFDIRIEVDVLGRYAYSLFERGKEGNYIFGLLREAINYEEKPKSNNFKDQLQKIQDEETLVPLQKFMNDLVESIAKDLNASPDDLNKYISKLFDEDLRFIEKEFFSDFYKLILLKKDFPLDMKKVSNIEFDKVKAGGPSAIKQDVLFNLFPLIIPNRAFKTENSDLSDYGGRFYKYKINTIKSIIGR